MRERERERERDIYNGRWTVIKVKLLCHGFFLSVVIPNRSRNCKGQEAAMPFPSD